jgi:hypothetical protein
MGKRLLWQVSKCTRWFFGRWWKHWFYLLCQLVAIYVVCLWIPYNHLPQTGSAVAIIAVLAALMSVHPNLRPGQKVLYLLLIAALLLIEFRAMYKDRADNEAKVMEERVKQQTEFGKIRSIQDDDFNKIAEGLKKAIDDSEKSISQNREQFNATMNHAEAEDRSLQRTLSAAQNAAENSPGGDSYLMALLNPVNQTVQVFKEGSAPLYAVNAVIHEFELPKGFPENEIFRSHDWRSISLGDFSSARGVLTGPKAFSEIL